MAPRLPGLRRPADQDERGALQYRDVVGGGNFIRRRVRVGHNAGASTLPAAESLLQISETLYAKRQVTDELREVVARVSSLVEQSTVDDSTTAFTLRRWTTAACRR